MLKIIFVLIGTFVGAGFASGKEVFNFFSVYKFNSFISIIIFSILLFFVIYKCFKIKIKFNINSYNEFMSFLEKKYKFFNSHFSNFIIHIFLAASFYIMIIALSSLFSYQLNIAKYITIFITIFICFLILYKKNINFIYIINSILMPILILFIISLCSFNINLNNISFMESNNINILFISIFYGLLYFSYNSLLIIPIIFDLKLNFNKDILFKISLLFAITIFILVFGVNLLLLCFYEQIKNLELPILYISNLSFFSFMYFFIVLSAIFTTMISSGYAFINSWNMKHFKLKLIVFLLLSFVFGAFSFSSLINFFYPIFGLIGFLQIFLILFDRS